MRARAEWRLEVQAPLEKAGLTKETIEVVQKLALSKTLIDQCVPPAQPQFDDLEDFEKALEAPVS